MLTIRIDEDTAIELLVERVTQWTEDEDVIELYRRMYDRYVYGGVFDYGEFDVKAIVDNDYVNWCRVVCEGEEDYEEIKAWFDENDCGDCSCELDCCDFIEAEYNGYFLVR